MSDDWRTVGELFEMLSVAWNVERVDMRKKSKSHGAGLFESVKCVSATTL